MKLYRLFTGKDNQSHFEKLDDNKASSLFNTVHRVKGLVFRIEDRPQLSDWHPAPRRQYIINLDNGVQITASDGESRVIGAGEVLLVEDTTGKGHLSKALNERIRNCIFVTLD